MELNLPFSFGVNTKIPAVAPTPGFFVSLQNISPEDSNLKVLDKRLVTHTAASTVRNLAFTFDPTSRFSDIFAFADTAVYRVNSTSLTSLFTPPSLGTTRWAVVQWRDTIYFTRPDVLLHKVSGNASASVPVVTGVDANSNNITLNLSAKYALAAHDHLWLANVTQNNTLASTTVRWSDLYNPERWEISETSESDLFQLGVNDLEITGLELHRNQVVIFTPKSIWTASYQGLPTVYQFEPIYANIGCGYHYSTVRVNEELYFIGADNVYRMNSFQLTPIGAPIWNTMRTDLQTLAEAPGFAVEDHKIIYWKVGSKTYVFNYEEDRWAIYDFVYAYSYLKLPGTLSRTASWDEVASTWDSTSVAWDAGVGTTSIQQLYYLSDGLNLNDTSAGTVIAHAVTFTTPYFYLESLWEEKELARVRLQHLVTGTVAITLTIRLRDSFNGATRTVNALQTADTRLTNESLFEFKALKPGKLISLQISYTNSASNFLSEIPGVTFEFIDGKPVR